MKTIPWSEFENLVSRHGWKREQEIEVLERLFHHRHIEDRNDKKSLDMNQIPHVWGRASKTSTLDGVKITYTERFSYDDYNPYSLSTKIEVQGKAWSIEGVAALDEDGEKMHAHDLSVYMNCDFSSIDYSFLKIEKVNNIDVEEESKMMTFNLEVDNAPNIRFTGELVASASSSDTRAMGSIYSGQTGYWTELALYKTRSGKFICYRIECIRWNDKINLSSGKVCETLTEVKEFFGHGRLAKDLYAKASIDDSVEVE